MLSKTVTATCMTHRRHTRTHAGDSFSEKLKVFWLHLVEELRESLLWLKDELQIEWQDFSQRRRSSWKELKPAIGNALRELQHGFQRAHEKWNHPDASTQLDGRYRYVASTGSGEIEKKTRLDRITNQ